MEDITCVCVMLIQAVLCCMYMSLHRDVEYKDMQLSQEQSRAAKSSLAFKSGPASSQDPRKQLKAKAVKIKSKLKTAPYPQVLQTTAPHSELLILFICTYSSRYYDE